MNREEAIAIITDAAARRAGQLHDGETGQGYPSESLLLDIALRKLTGWEPSNWNGGPKVGTRWDPETSHPWLTVTEAL